MLRVNRVFQAHRKLLGLVCVGQCQRDTDLADLYGAYDDLKSQYVSTLFDTRLIVLGLTKEGKTIPSEKETGSSSSGDSPTSDEVNDGIKTQGNCNHKMDSIEDIDNSKVTGEKHIVNLSDKNHNDNKLQSKDPPDKFEDPLNVNVKTTSDKTSPVSQKLVTNTSSPNRTPKQSPVKEASGGLQKTNDTSANSRDGSRPHVIFYPSLEESSDLEERLREFAASLFWVLESKRLDRSQERLEKLPLLMTPFEKKDFVGIDTESR